MDCKIIHLPGRLPVTGRLTALLNYQCALIRNAAAILLLGNPTLDMSLSVYDMHMCRSNTFLSDS